jgi:hypothetical protein
MRSHSFLERLREIEREQEQEKGFHFLKRKEQQRGGTIFKAKLGTNFEAASSIK